MNTMNKLRSALAAVVTAAVLAACGGGGAPEFDRVVSFGDSLSDVGTYATPGLVAATGGGKYTVNSASARIWVEQLATRLNLGTLCAAQTGLNSSGPLAGFAAPVTNKSGCYAYGQGGARVTQAVGPANAALIALGDSSGYLGQLTDPVVNQMNRHLTAGGYTGSELVVVLAGGNDLFMNLGAVGAGTPVATAVTAMGTAGAELAGYIKSLVLDKGAKYVLVVTLPDVSKTPFAYSQSAQTQGLIQTMSKTFNDQLTAGLAGLSRVIVADGYGRGQDVAARPAAYGITNGTATACDLSKATLGSLGCSAATLVAGDVSHYQFADSVHPTPYGHQLYADLAMEALAKAGWVD